MVPEKKTLKWMPVLEAIPEKWVCIAFPATHPSGKPSSIYNNKK
jgi:hypothetical protein